LAQELWSFEQGMVFICQKPVPKYPALIVIGKDSVEEEECLFKFQERIHNASMYPYSEIRKDFGCWPDPFDLCRRIMEDFNGQFLFVFNSTNYFEELVAYAQETAEAFVSAFLHSQFVGGVVVFLEKRFERLVKRAVFNEKFGIGCGGVAIWQ